jgi:Kef-type K+ transport system membrane component KefB
MAEQLTLIVEMVTVLGAATVGGLVASRLRQPALLGYLVSGMVVGPFGLKLVEAEGDIQVLSEVGVALLLFALGVEFSLKELLRVRAIALGGLTATPSDDFARGRSGLSHRLGGYLAQSDFLGGSLIAFINSRGAEKFD